MHSALPLPSSLATAPVLLREHYRTGKNALLASLAGSGASTRGIHSLLHKLARHTDSALRQLWLRADFPAGCALVAVGGSNADGGPPGRVLALPNLVATIPGDSRECSGVVNPTGSIAASLASSIFASASAR